MKFGLFLMPEPFPWSNWTLSYDLKLEDDAEFTEPSLIGTSPPMVLLHDPKFLRGDSSLPYEDTTTP